LASCHNLSFVQPQPSNIETLRKTKFCPHLKILYPPQKFNN
jgi:hypothetical protein